MRLLVATGLYPPESGGPATYSKLIEEYLPRHGIKVTVMPFRTVRHLPRVVRHLAYFFKLLAQPADLIYALDTVSVGLPAALAATVRRKKLVVRVPGDYAWEQARQRFGVKDEMDEFQTKSYGFRVGALRAAQCFVVRRAAAVVVPSEYMHRVVSKWTPRPAHVIYSSIAPPTPAPVERPKGFLVLSFGRHVPWKGFEALERVVAREKDWTLKIFSELPYAEAMGWLKAADVYVNNSTYEGLSHQLVEALTLGTPIIATRVGGNPEVVGECGLLIPPHDEEALYRALHNIENDRAGAATRAAEGRERAKRFSIDVAVDKLVQLLNTCASL